MNFLKKIAQLWSRLIQRLNDDIEESHPEGRFISYNKMSEALRSAVKRHADKVGRVTVVPHKYIIHLSEADRKRRQPYEDTVLKELKDEILAVIKERNFRPDDSKLIINFETDAGLETGRVKVECSAVAPSERETDGTLLEK